MRAVAEAAAACIVHSFKSVKLAVGGAKTCCRGERRQVRARRLLYRCGQGALTECICEEPRSLLQRREIFRRVLRRCPRVVEARRVVIADARAALSLWRIPAAPLRR